MATPNCFERHEQKYLVDARKYLALRTQFKDRLVPDFMGSADGSYPILSLYYDTKDQGILYRALARGPYKTKLRLRAYGSAAQALASKAGDDAGSLPVYLELKSKFEGVSYKRRLGLTYAEAQDLALRGQIPKHLQAVQGQIAREILAFRDRYALVNTLPIYYERQALVSSDAKEGLRITFDQSLEGPRGMLLAPGHYLMEIKCRGPYPPWLIQALSHLKIYPHRFSKFIAAATPLYHNAGKPQVSEVTYGHSTPTNYPANPELRIRANPI